MSLPGIRLRDLPQRGEQVPRDPGSRGYPGFVLGPPTAQRWTLGRLETRPRVLPSGDSNTPGIWLLGLGFSTFLSPQALGAGDSRLPWPSVPDCV